MIIIGGWLLEICVEQDKISYIHAKTFIMKVKSSQK